MAARAVDQTLLRHVPIALVAGVGALPAHRGAQPLQQPAARDDGLLLRRRRRADRAHRPERADLARPRRADGGRRLRDGQDPGAPSRGRWRSCCWRRRSSPRSPGRSAGAAAARLRGPYLAGATLALAVGLPALATKFSGFLGGSNGLTVTPPIPPQSLGATFPLERWQAWIALPGRARHLRPARQPRAQRLRTRVPRRARRRGRCRSSRAIHVARTQIARLRRQRGVRRASPAGCWSSSRRSSRRARSRSACRWPC